jgi:hypothetical protein
MKILYSRRQNCSGQVMAEACIGLALMTFVWIIVTYSLFMANNQIRTVMAARYAAWYQGANNSGTIATASQMDQYFFYQSGLSTVTKENPKTAGDIISAIIPIGLPKSVTQIFDLNDGTDANGPFKVSVSFGVQNANSTTFPFSMLKTHVPFMPDSTMTVLSVKSSAQWDGIADTWNTAGQALGVIWNALKNLVTSLF